MGYGGEGYYFHFLFSYIKLTGYTFTGSDYFFRFLSLFTLTWR